LNFLVSTDNDALFATLPAIDPTTGTLTYAPAANAFGTAHVTVRLHDDGGTAFGGVDTSAPLIFTIAIDAINDVPSFASGSDETITEDAGPQTVVGWASSISAGPNEASQALNFVVTTDNDVLFATLPAIDPATGTLSYAPAANAFGTAHVTVWLHDDGGTANGGVDTSPPQSFVISINPVNDAPSFTAGADQLVGRNAGSQTVAAWASSISPGSEEANQAVNFSLSVDNPGLFSAQPAIDAAGTLTYTPAPGVLGTAHVTVELHDDGGTALGGVDVSAPVTFAISVDFINQPPSFTAGANQTVNENSGPQTVAGWAANITQGMDETGQSLNFVLSADDESLFSSQPAIDPASGTLTYTPAANASGTATVTVFLHDDGGTANGGHDVSNAQSFTIAINAVNQPPSFLAGGDESVNEDSGPQSFLGWARSISAGPNEANQAVNFVVSADKADLFSAGPAIDASGNLTFTPGLHKAGVAQVSVRLHDDGGTALGGDDTSPVQTFAITIQPVNHSPTVAAPIADQTLDENAADLAFALGGVFNDVDVPNGDHLNFSIAANDNPASLAASISNGVLTLHLVPNQIGSAHLVLRATDDAGLSVDAPFTVTVNAVNQAPSFLKGADQRVLPDAGAVVVPGWAKNLSPGPSNESAQTLSFQATGDTNASLFLVSPSVDPASGDLHFTPAFGASGSAILTFALKDSGGTANGGHDTSAPQSFRITVNAAPSAQGEVYVLSDAGGNTAATVEGVLSSDIDPDGDPLTAELVSGPAHGTLTLHPDGSFTYLKGADFAGLDEFTYRSNDGLATSGIVTIRIVSYQASIVDKLYEQVLNRDPEDSGLLYWTNRIQNGDPYSAIAQGIFESNERLDPIIDQYYHDFLLRPSEPSGLAYWRDQVWKRDGGPENVIAGMISSPEFFQSAGGTNADWIQALYQRLLGRPADPHGLDFWESQLGLQLETEQQVVLGFTQSDENFKNLIGGFFQQYLQRAPSSKELDDFLKQMEADASQRDIQIEIIDSDEYRNTPPPPASGVAEKFVP
jgi:hypothetical protein